MRRRWLSRVIPYPVERAVARFYPDYQDDLERLEARLLECATADAVVVDVGCGRASYAVPSRRLGTLVVGIDSSPRVRENTWAQHRVQGDIYRLPLASESVDLVILRYVLEHLEAPLQALWEISRVLRPGGKVVLLTPNRHHYVSFVARHTPLRFHRWFLSCQHRRPADEAFVTRYQANTVARLRRLADSAGLRLSACEFHEGPPWYLMWWWPAFMLGVAYERLVNRFDRLAGLRVTMLATLEKR